MPKLAIFEINSCVHCRQLFQCNDIKNCPLNEEPDLSKIDVFHVKCPLETKKPNVK